MASCPAAPAQVRLADGGFADHAVGADQAVVERLDAQASLTDFGVADGQPGLNGIPDLHLPWIRSVTAFR